VTRRLLLSYLAITVVVLALLEVPLGIFSAQRDRDRFANDVERDATVIASIYEDDLENDRQPDDRAAEEYEARTGARVVIVDRDGISLVDTGADGGTDSSARRDFSTRPEIRTALGGSRAVGIRRSDTLDTSLLFVAVPVASGGEVHGAVRVTLDAGSIDARIRDFWIGLAAMAAIVLTIAALIGWALARSFSRPIRRLNETAARFGRGDLTAPGETPAGPPELRNLATTMATMADRLDALIKEQRAFVADASHQLRTPLTALRLRLENLQSRLADDDAAELDAVIEESSRLAALVTDLLQLARADQHPSPAEVDLAALVAERVDMWSAVADIDDVRLALDAPTGALRAAAVPGAVEQILDNLLDNALKVSPPGSTVTVTLTSGTSQHRLSVSDQGPGLSDDDKQRAPRRFWRGDTSTPGTGLGLAIASALASASGGHLDLADTPDHGLTVTLHLPASAGPPTR
jgi:signal transduction histidine kinase